MVFLDSKARTFPVVSHFKWVMVALDFLLVLKLEALCPRISNLKHILGIESTDRWETNDILSRAQDIPRNQANCRLGTGGFVSI